MIDQINIKTSIQGEKIKLDKNSSEIGWSYLIALYLFGRFYGD